MGFLVSEMDSPPEGAIGVAFGTTDRSDESRGAVQPSSRIQRRRPVGSEHPIAATNSESGGSPNTDRYFEYRSTNGPEIEVIIAGPGDAGAARG